MLTQTQAQQSINDAVTCHQQGDLDHAEAIYRRVLASQPDNPDALHLLGVVAKQRRQYSQSIELITAAIKHNPQGPNTADYHNNCAEAHRANFQYAKAFSHYQAAIALRGQATASLLFNVGGCFQELGQHAEATECFNQAIALSPDPARAYFRRAYSLLSTDQYEAGWRDYEWHVQALTQEHYIRPPWGGPVLPRPSDAHPLTWQNTRTLLISDQGLGDEICLLRFLPALCRLGTTPYYDAPDKLNDLISRHNLSQLWDGTTQDFDHIFCVSDLPGLTGMHTLSDLPEPLTLSPEPKRSAKFSQQLENMPHPWIGLTWRAGMVDQLQSQLKEIPLKALLQSFTSFSGTLVILQRGMHEDERNLLIRSGGTTLDFSVESEDLEDSLAILELLDNYVAVANTNVHLRTALNKPTHVLTAANAIDYRWPAILNHSPWFPNCRAYRQSTDGSWTSAIADLRSALA